MASVHAHGLGWRVHYMLDGQKRKSPTLPSEADAQAWIAEHLPLARDDHLLTLVDLWRQREPSPHRDDAARRVSRVIAAQRWGAPGALTAAALRAWVAQDRGWRRPCQYLRTVLRWAHRDMRVPIRQEVLAWRPPKVPRSAKPPLLTDAQADLIRDQAATLGERALAVVDYLMTYGARPITACRLRLPALDVEHGELVLGLRDAVTGRKGEKHSGGWRHRVYDRHLDAWPALTGGWFYEPAPVGIDQVPIFPHYAENRPWRIANGRADELVSFYVNRIGRPLRQHLGPLIGIYHLKRYAITRLFRAGVEPSTIALFTGHLDTNQLMTYATSNADLQDEALARLEAFSSGSQKGSQVPTQTL